MAKIKPDFNFLRTQTLSSNTGNPKPKDSLVWREFLIANYNFVDECSFKISEEEVSEITISLQNWVNKRNSNEYFSKDRTGNFVKTNVNVGDIFLADLGLNFEKGYCRTIVVLDNIGDMILIVPTTTQNILFASAYHPVDNKDGDKLYRRVYKQNGFNENCVLLFNNTRIISKGRLLESSNSIKDSYQDEYIYDSIMYQVFENLLPKFYQNHLNILKENAELKKRIEILEENNKK